MPPQLDIYTCITAVAYTLLSYDYTLTIAREIELFWRKPKRSWTFALFIANRYITILGHVPQLIYSILSPATRADYSWCDSLLLASQVVIYVVQTIGGVVMTIRVYALYQNSRLVLVFLGAFMFVTIVLGCPRIDIPQGCVTALPMIVPRSTCYVAAVWSGQLVFDILVFLLTLVRSLQIRKESSRSIVDTLLWDDAIRVMCGINIANITILLDLGNVDFKAYVEPSRSEGNRSNGFVTVFIVACKHGICRSTYWL
ncbi:hypothetical protein V8B97DRAFT_1918591 [Scleroderma yunnanense]